MPKPYQNNTGILGNRNIPFPIGKNLLNIHTMASVRGIAFLRKVPGAGFEPAKLYAEDLESTPFDRSGTPACTQRSNPLFLTIALQQGHQDLWGAAVEGFDQAWPCRLVGG